MNDTYSKSDIYSHVPYRDLDSDKNEMFNGNMPMNYYVISEPDSGSSFEYFFDNRFWTSIFHSVRNNNYEIYVMYTLIIVTLLLLISIAFGSSDNYDTTIMALRRAEIRR